MVYTPGPSPQGPGPDPSGPPISNSGPVERTPGRIWLIPFKYRDPAVNVTTEQNTVEHETIDDTIVVQTLGEQAKQITIDAVVTETETTFVDLLTQQGPVTMRTERYSGTVVVTSTDTEYRREKDARDEWLYDASIECLQAGED